ncbi:unnamed protein product [Victoria cruziana]
MSQVDNRNSSASKRARTDGSRREDDWTCPSCGNVNFSFRTTCNMRNCTQSRPAEHNLKSAKPPQAPQGFNSSAPYLGPGGASSMYLGYPYDYANRLSAGGPYGPMMSGPNPYSGGSVMGAGGMYGIPSLMDRYGMGLPMAPGVMGTRPGPFSDDNSQKRAADGMRDSDWTCPKCGNVNFSFRTVCNMRKCGTPKPGSHSKGGKVDNAKGSKSNMPEGSWKCEKCNNINYPFRTKCNRQNCGAEKPSEAKKSPRSATDEDEQ